MALYVTEAWLSQIAADGLQNRRAVMLRVESSHRQPTSASLSVPTDDSSRFCGGGGSGGVCHIYSQTHRLITAAARKETKRVCAARVRTVKPKGSLRDDASFACVGLDESACFAL